MRIALLSAVLVACFGQHICAEAPAHPSDAREDPTWIKAFPNLGLTLTLPPLSGLATDTNSDARVKGRWTGTLGASRVEIELCVFPLEPGLDEPDDVLDGAIATALDPKKGGGTGLRFERSEIIAGAFGYVEYAASAHGRDTGESATAVKAERFLFAGILKDDAYLVRVHAAPPLADDAAKLVHAFLRKGVVYKGEVRNWKWTDEAAKARWLDDAPPETHKKYEKPIRTAHYIILTSSSGGAAFAKQMEQCYDAIQKVYPFPEIPCRKLMPVFLFRTPDEYYAFYARAFESTVEEAEKSKGVASLDFYATWYEAPNDPVHIHEATHQIFDLRLRLSGGGSWFQEGVAEYIGTKANERGNAARAVKKREHMPIEELVTIESLLWSTEENKKGGDDAGDLYEEAALLIEFLRESKWGKDRFLDFVHAVGVAPPNDLAEIERAVKTVYGTGLKGLEDQWVEYCKKR